MIEINFEKLFPDKREEYETVIEQSQAVMLRMLKILHFLCIKHDVQYFLSGGTCIGAIRHKGFIPWDDDLDIGMTRVNYNKFRKKVIPDLPKDIFYQDTNTDKGYPHCFYVDARLRDKYSSYTRLDGGKNKWHDGLQIDIFVFDQAYIKNKYINVFLNIFINKFTKNDSKRESVLSTITSNINWVTLVYSCNWQQTLGMLKKKYGTVYILQEEISKYQLVPFEDMEAYVLVEYDAILRRQYGDYLKLPPKNERRSVHNVEVNPFMPCDHEEILFWENRTN